MSDPALHALAGAVGGMVAIPLVVLSTRAAVDSKHDNKVLVMHRLNSCADIRYTFVQVTLDIIKREGFRGLYSGLSSSLVGIAVTNGVYYYFYERSRAILLKSRPGRKRRALSTAESILAGLIAGSATTIMSNPIWVVQTSQAVHSTNANVSDTSASRPQKLGMFDAIEKILSKDGPAGFWRGIGPALALVINPVIQYTVFEQLKNLLTERRMARLPKGRQGSALAMLTDWDFFVLGAFSKLVATGTTYPYIVVKSRLQAGHVQAERYKSTLRGLLTIFEEEGLQGLYGGAKSKLLQSVLTAAILFTAQRRIYELTTR
ncbi:peroxisomal membrane protein PMP47B [Boletus reticuloceps]|uniref:Peroxisomal membrane protein PMP47B n=1 Tax=Boletus reticuloceps TaxID=495285 RepID=A0A8I2YTH9_9AGAM|nr:peroxisomal membrane protein PMP47B [Boletus reticuloceps]